MRPRNPANLFTATPIAAALAAITLATPLWTGSAQSAPATTATRLLPQALPGTSYAAQLAIPPGLGYPFAHCELAGQSPRWLTIDCARLQLKGRVPTAPANADANYQLTLRIEDNTGNTQTFPLALRVSNNPQVVSLAEPLARDSELDPPTAPAVAPARLSRTPLAARPAPVRIAGSQQDAEPESYVGEAPESAEDATPTPVETPQAAGDDTPALRLQDASIVNVGGAPRAAKAGAHITKIPSRIHAVAAAASPKACEPPPGAGGPPVSQEADAQTKLTNARNECSTGKAACARALPPLEQEAENTAAALKDCGLNGLQTPVPAPPAVDMPLGNAVKDWYQGRAAIWQALADDMAQNAKTVKSGTYSLPKALTDKLEKHEDGEPPDSQTETAPPSGLPFIVGDPEAGAASINIQAAANTNLSLYRIPDYDPTTGETYADDAAPKACSPSLAVPANLIPLKTSSTDAAVVTSVPVSLKKGEAAGVQAVYPQQSLLAGTRICVSATGPAKNGVTPDPKYSRVAAVRDPLDWGRVRAYFVGGALISNTENNFSSSSANQFLDLNVDKFWIVPQCATALNKDGDCSRKSFRRWPGVSTYFDTRLTAIPVAVKNTTTSTGGTTAGDNSLTTQKTARVQVAAYAPWVLANWNYNHTGNALYVAPIAKVGFDTLTGTTTPTGTVNGMTTTAALNRVYNFYSFGTRVGHFGLYPTKSKSPELQSYLDINFGPYSNLSSYICTPLASWGPANPSTATGANPTTTPVSSCGVAPYAALPSASEKRIWRLDLEGLLKIPSTPLVIGFNANIGQREIGSKNLDALRAPADDVRFLFGTKFDVACVLKKLGVGQAGSSTSTNSDKASIGSCS